ncbi:hypothetical protein MKX03_009084 [Papaver bracteatum]|nr:hypothetical protein MKX03_009084 [Papaver bracteatum]
MAHGARDFVCRAGTFYTSTLENAADWLYQMSSWKGMLNEYVWEDFVVQFIVPRLKNVLQQLDIMSWVTVVPSHHMVTMLETIFFPKLCSGIWDGKVSLTTELQAHHRVRYELNVCLEMMHQAAEDMDVRQMQFEAQKKAATFYAQLQEEAKASKLRRVTSSGHYEMSLNAIIESYAEKNQLSFKPKQGRTHSGFQNVNVCVDSANQSIFAQTNEGWSLVSLEVLLEIHQSSMTK